MNTTRRWRDWEPGSAGTPETPKKVLGNAKKGTLKNIRNPASGVFEVFEGSSPAKSQNFFGALEPTSESGEPSTPGGCTRPQNDPPAAVEVWAETAGGRVFIVADYQDAQAAVERLNASLGETWTGAEVELVARIEDPAIRAEVAAFKRQFGGRLAPSVPGIPFAEWKAEALNKLFREQRGRPGHISASTVRDGERKGG